MSDLVVNVRQIGNYPHKAALGAADALLAQEGGLGGPYVQTGPEGLLAPLAGGSYPLGVGVTPPPGGQGVYATGLTLRPGDPVAWNGATLSYAPSQGLTFTTLGGTLLRLAADGQLTLTRQIRLGRDPASALEAATLGWVQNHTVGSFNGRVGTVRLTTADIYRALDLDPCNPLVTVSDTNAAICAAIQQLLQTYPAIWSFNGRTGDIWLNVHDVNRALTAHEAQGRSNTPAAWDRSNRIATTRFVGDLIDTNEAELQAWVIEQNRDLSRVHISATAPTPRLNGDLWWSSVTGNLFVFYVSPDSGEGAWVIANSAASSGAGGAGGAAISVGPTAPFGPHLGDGWLNTTGNIFSVFDSLVWQSLGYLPLTGGNVSGNINSTSLAVTGATTLATATATTATIQTLNVTTAATVPTPTLNGHATTKLYVDTEIANRKYATTLTGDGTATSFPVTHNRNTTDVTVTIWDATSNHLVLADIVRTSVNVITVEFATAPATGQNYRVVVMG